MFGGINFKLQPIQHNWDCQEAMLGYFNFIDNVFDAQEVLKFLVQDQEKDNFLHKDTLNIVLLDEMNLANIELYFVEFLSKLEVRCCKGKNEVPVLDIKLGADLEPYPLSLGRNVLWFGILNQDETNKSLSDKVIDRSNILFFPRPETFVSRPSLKNLYVQRKQLSGEYLSMALGEATG